MSRILPVFILVASCTVAAQVPTTSTRAVLPDQFTTSDLRAALGLAAAGVIDPEHLISALAKHGGESVTMMGSLLYDESICELTAMTRSQSIPPGSVRRFTPMPSQVLLVRAIQACGSAEAYASLFRAATDHPNPQIRGLSLHSLAHSFRDEAKIGLVHPDKSVLYLFLSKGNDTTQINFIEKSIAQVAREGLRFWTGKDGGWPLSLRVRTVSTTHRNPGIPEYWQLWWRKRSARITWDAERAIFVLPR